MEARLPNLPMTFMLVNVFIGFLYLFSLLNDLFKERKSWIKLEDEKRKTESEERKAANVTLAPEEIERRKEERRCGVFPDVLNIRYNNEHWQEVQYGNRRKNKYL